jgi:membrane-bound serine protease (ClpP class)
MLIREDPIFPLLKLSLMVILSTVGLTVLFFLFILGLGVKALKLKPVTGVEGFIGETGVVLQDLDPYGTVHVHGEIWQAESVSGKIEKGATVRVLSEKSFRIKVERV